MKDTIEEIEPNDQIKLNIRKKKLFVESVEGEGLNKKIFLTGIGTGSYLLRYDPDENVCRFYRKRSKRTANWKSPRFVEDIEIVKKNASKAEHFL